MNAIRYNFNSLTSDELNMPMSEQERNYCLKSHLLLCMYGKKHPEQRVRRKLSALPPDELKDRFDFECASFYFENFVIRMH